MNQEIRKQIAGMNYAYWHYPFDYFLDSMNRIGLENIEIWGGSPHFDIEDFSSAQIRALRRNIADHQLKIVCYTPEQVNYPVNIAAREGDIRARSVGYFIKNIEVCAELGCPMIVAGPGWGYLNEPKQEAWSRSLDSLKTLAEKAQKLKIIIALEPLTTISSNLINYAAELSKMLDDLNEPNVKGMLDIGQMSILNETVDDYYEVLGAKGPIHVHLIDGRPTGHMAFGDGNLPLCYDYFRLLERGYRGYMTMEINDRFYFLDPEKAFRQSIDMMEIWLKR